VPVIVGAGSWSPPRALPTVAEPDAGPALSDGAPFRNWLADQLIRDYPGLVSSGRSSGVSLAASLIETGRILPIMDGFDEIVVGLHRAALQDLNATAIPMVLTSRPDQY